MRHYEEGTRVCITGGFAAALGKAGIVRKALWSDYHRTWAYVVELDKEIGGVRDFAFLHKELREG
jgi:hypothetical protein